MRTCSSYIQLLLHCYFTDRYHPSWWKALFITYCGILTSESCHPCMQQLRLNYPAHCVNAHHDLQTHCLTGSGRWEVGSLSFTCTEHVHTNTQKMGKEKSYMTLCVCVCVCVRKCSVFTCLQLSSNQSFITGCKMSVGDCRVGWQSANQAEPYPGSVATYFPMQSLQMTEFVTTEF